MKKLTKKKVLEVSRKIKDKIKIAKTGKELAIAFRAYHRAELIYNCAFNKNKNWTKDKYIKRPIADLLKYNETWKEQAEERRWMIQSHPTFFCPVSSNCLDMNNSFLYHNNIFDMEVLSVLKEAQWKEITLT